LNPDLLEQRIGRLDRIGQNETINIYVPYLKGIAQAVLFRWYHEGLDAFEHTCPAGQTVYVQLIDELYGAMFQPDSDIDQLITKTCTLYQELTDALHRGRDRLLEYNSCRSHVATKMISRAVEYDKKSRLYEYMENVFDCYGVDTEIHSKGCYIIQPTDNMFMRFPGLADDGMTITYSRETALAFEDAHFLTWEHPLVSTAMDMVLNNEMGNTALTAIEYQGAPSGTLLLECLYIIEAAPIETLQTSRYLPPTTLRIVIDEKGKNHNDQLTHEAINVNRIQVDSDTSNKIVHAKLTVLKKMAAHSETLVQGQAKDILALAHNQSEETLMREINRLKALRLVNPNVRVDEINYFERQLKLLAQAIDSASLRLDAVRVIVAT